MRPCCKAGDIVNVDLTTIVNGWYGDQSETFLIGNVSDTARRLVQVTFDCLFRGIRAIKPNGRVNDIGPAIFDYARVRMALKSSASTRGTASAGNSIRTPAFRTSHTRTT